MGLDISAYSKLTPATVPDGIEEPSDWAYQNHATVIYLNPDFPHRADEFKDRAVYRYEQVIGFRAGSYSGYNRWREWLASLVGTTPQVEWHELKAKGPFHELINFSDAEGTIGKSVSAKLAKDFAEHQAEADAVQDGYERELYAKWREAFELAADGGAVCFH